MPNQIIQSLPIKLSIDSLILNNGKEIVRERSRGSLRPGVLFFDRTRLTATPIYHDFSLKILPSDVHDTRDIMEGIKTFWANTFVLKSNNLAKDNKPAKAGTASVTRHRDEEFMQFLWISLRKSLGKVVGGFK